MFIHQFISCVKRISITSVPQTVSLSLDYIPEGRPWLCLIQPHWEQNTPGIRSLPSGPPGCAEFPEKWRAVSRRRSQETSAPEQRNNYFNNFVYLTVSVRRVILNWMMSLLTQWLGAILSTRCNDAKKQPNLNAETHSTIYGCISIPDKALTKLVSEKNRTFR